MGEKTYADLGKGSFGDAGRDDVERGYFDGEKEETPDFDKDEMIHEQPMGGCCGRPRGWDR